MLMLFSLSGTHPTTTLSHTTASRSEAAMLGAHFCVRNVSDVSTIIYQSNARRSVASPLRSSFVPATMRPWVRRNLLCNLKPVLISYNSKSGTSGGSSCDDGDSDRDYVPATLLLAETLSHYRMRHQRYQEEGSSPVTHKFRPLSNKAKGPKADSQLIGQGLLHHFPSPTIFLKITCNGDFFLPIVVADYAIEKLIDAIQGDENQDYPDQFQFMKNLPEKVGCKMEMVRITERIVSTYIARLYFSKMEKDDLLSVDVRPSDAINIAYRCQLKISAKHPVANLVEKLASKDILLIMTCTISGALVPIYVHKHIVLTDAIMFGYGVDKTRDTKSVYDVSLDSAEDGPDVVSEELDLVKSMNLAIKEERYIDAAMLREKLTRLRNSKI